MQKEHSSLVAKFPRYLLQTMRAANSPVTRCKIRSLLDAENHSLFVAKLSPYLLQKLLVAKIQLIAEFIRCSLQTSIVTCCVKSQEESILVKFSYGRQNLNEFDSIYLMFYIDKNHLLPRYGSSHPRLLGK